LRPEALLADVIDEKGTFTEEHVTFDINSTFGVVQAKLADGDEVLVCDDLGDEWADFIGLNNTSSPPRITFYHAKHGELSLGAGPFHVSVSQAIKNLQRMSLPAEAMGKEISRWKKSYINGGVETSIPRISRGDPNRLRLPARATELTGSGSWRPPDGRPSFDLVAEYGLVASPVKAALRSPPPAAIGLDTACHEAFVCHQRIDGGIRPQPLTIHAEMALDLCASR
jgi:hypothetical protein